MSRNQMMVVAAVVIVVLAIIWAVMRRGGEHATSQAATLGTFAAADASGRVQLALFILCHPKLMLSKGSAR
jgi:hypothetical protein